MPAFCYLLGWAVMLEASQVSNSRMAIPARGKASRSVVAILQLAPLTEKIFFVSLSHCNCSVGPLQ